LTSNEQRNRFFASAIKDHVQDIFHNRTDLRLNIIGLFDASLKQLSDYFITDAKYRFYFDIYAQMFSSFLKSSEAPQQVPLYKALDTWKNLEAGFQIKVGKLVAQFHRYLRAIWKADSGTVS
jgi:hypothetical protein